MLARAAALVTICEGAKRARLSRQRPKRRRSGAEGLVNWPGDDLLPPAYTAHPATGSVSDPDRLSGTRMRGIVAELTAPGRGTPRGSRYADQRPYVVSERLDDLHGPATGQAVLSRRLDRSGRARYDLDNPRRLASRRWIRQAVLRSDARHDQSLRRSRLHRLRTRIGPGCGDA